MLVFTFVTTIFLFVTTMVLDQKAVITNQQTFANLQMVAQSIAHQLNIASKAGSGYAANIPISSAFGINLYNITITRSGTVIAYAKYGRQFINAVAYSNSQGVYASNDINTNYLMLQNSFGEICVDIICANSTSGAAQISLSSISTHAALLNGNSGYIQLQSQPSWSTALTVSAWINTKATPSTGNYFEIFNNNQVFMRISGDPTDHSVDCFVKLSDGSVEPRATSGIVPLPNSWYMATCTWASNTLSIYVNGKLEDTSSRAGTLASSTVGPYIGSSEQAILPPHNTWNGLISNVQLYGTGLSSQQVHSLYQEGINAQPISGAGILGWYPLDGNANDYSGNGNNGYIHGPVLFPAVSELQAKATNKEGYAISNVLIGFATTLGNFTFGQSYANYTDANGIARAFLTQQGANGYARVKATLYTENISTSNSLVGWWPLNLDQGNFAQDISGYGSTANMIYASWSNPASVAQFNGRDSYVSLGNSLVLNTGQVTVSGWVYINSTSVDGNRHDLFDDSESTSDLGTGGGIVFAMPSESSQGEDIHFWVTINSPHNWYAANAPIITNRWAFVTGTYNGSDVNLFINGQLADSYPISGSFLQPQGSSFIGSCEQFVQGGYCGEAANGYVTNPFNGKAADLQIYNIALTPSQVKTLYGEGMSAPPIMSANAIGWYPLNGNANDYSGNGYNGTIAGGTLFVPLNSQQSESSNINASSMLSASFNGVSSYVAIPPSKSLDITGNVISLDAWVRISAPSSLSEVISNEPTGGGYYMWIDSTYRVHFGFNHGTGEVVSYAPLLQGRWYNLAGVYNGTKLSIYIDGEESNSISASLPISNANWTFIGAYGGNTVSAYTDFINGNISGAQIYDSALSPADISNLYQEGMAGLPLNNANLSGWWPLDGNAKDYSSNANAGNAVNVTYSPQQSVPISMLYSMSGYGADFNDSTIIAASPNSMSNDWAKGWTIGGWIQYTATNSIGICGYIGGIQQNAGTPRFGVAAGCDRAYPLPYVELINSGGSNCNTFSTNSQALQPNTWYYLTGTWNSTTGEIEFYVNGMLYAENQCPTGTWNPSSITPGSPFNYVIGGVGGTKFTGRIADVMLYNEPLPASEIYKMYANGMPPDATATIPLAYATQAPAFNIPQTIPFVTYTANAVVTTGNQNTFTYTVNKNGDQTLIMIASAGDGISVTTPSGCITIVNSTDPYQGFSVLNCLDQSSGQHSVTLSAPSGYGTAYISYAAYVLLQPPPGHLYRILSSTPTSKGNNCDTASENLVLQSSEAYFCLMDGEGSTGAGTPPWTVNGITDITTSPSGNGYNSTIWHQTASNVCSISTGSSSNCFQYSGVGVNVT